MGITKNELAKLGYKIVNGAAVRLDSQPQPNNGLPLERILQKPKKSKAGGIRLGFPKPAVRVTVEAFACRPLDPDNQAAAFKHVLDSLRYNGLLYDDSSGDINLQIRATKVETKTEERLLVTLELLHDEN